MTIQHITFNSARAGKHLVIFGAIHGNEHCGPEAIRQIAQACERGDIAIDAGKVTFVPVCNPRAYAANTRFIDRNLNRYFYPKDTHESYEDTLDPILCTLLDDADVLLDIHSYQSQGGAFAFLGTTSQDEIDYARALNLPNYIYGWADAFGDDNATETQKLASIGTTDYTRQKPKSGIAVTVECGHHHNDDNVEIACDVIKRALAFCDITSSSSSPASLSAQSCIQMQTVFYKEKAGKLTKLWNHCDAVSKEEVIAIYEDGEKLIAPDDGVLVLPKASTDHAIGAEWFYFGVKTLFPSVS